MIFKKTLAELHTKKIGKVSDKWEIFVSVYERIFRDHRSLGINMLEIGVQNGGSLEVWAKYFKSANLILGCDIDQLCGLLKFDDARIRVLVGDATLEQTKQRVLELASSFDIIIDDGSHHSKDIINAFLLYFPLVKPGGIFVVEDTHTLYWEEFGGGLKRADSAKEFFKNLTDVVNFEHWRGNVEIGEYVETGFDLKDPGFIAEGWVESIEFQNSMIIIRKADLPTHEKLGQRLISGTDAAVNVDPVRLREALSRRAR